MLKPVCFLNTHNLAAHEPRFYGLLFGPHVICTRPDKPAHVPRHHSELGWMRGGPKRTNQLTRCGIFPAAKEGPPRLALVACCGLQLGPDPTNPSPRQEARGLRPFFDPTHRRTPLARVTGWEKAVTRRKPEGFRKGCRHGPRGSVARGH